MRKFLVITIVILGILFGCQPRKDTELVQLNRPDNLSVEHGLLTWDSVVNAEGYIIYINDVSVHSDVTSYLIDSEGQYDVYIIATAEGFMDSLSSETISFTIEYSQNVVFEIEINEDNKTISWNDVNDMNHYILYINDDSYNVTTNQFSYSDLNPGLLTIRLQVVYPIGESNVSEEVYVEHLLEEITLVFQYSKHSKQNIIILNHDLTQITLFDENHQKLNLSDVLDMDDEIEIKSEYVLSLESDQVVFFIYSGYNKYKVQITMNNKTEPYLISSSIIYTDGNKDISFQFELFDGNVKQISGNQLDNKDYSIEDSCLIINHDYIQESFELDNRISLSYTLEDKHIVFGFIMIYQQNI